MLTGLKIRNFVLVDNVDLEFHDGLTVLSGETGAGKSIIIEAICLTLGKRANSNLIRADAEKAEITATFEVKPDSPVKSILEEFDYENEQCILRRVLFHGGKSRAYCNENPVTSNFLKNLSTHLVDIHAQQQSQQVLESQYQRELLDLYADSKKNNDKVNNIYEKWKVLQEELSFLESTEGKSHRLELLEYQLKELDSLSLEPQELESIEDRHKHLTFAETNQQIYLEVQSILEDDENGAINAIQRAFNLLKKVKSENKDSLNATLEQVEELIKDVIRESERAQETNQVDSQLLRETETRLEDLHRLARKHDCSIKELSTVFDILNAEKEKIERESERIQDIKKQISAIEEDFKKEANTLTAKRKNATKKMASEIINKLATLGIPEVKFDILLENRMDQEPVRNGLEKIAFFIATNPGQRLANMAGVVSGGELSRVSLAIQAVISSKFKIPTLVFDEVDSGIGGSTASVVGWKLREVSANCQVLCITHSPQVASAGDHHYLIDKITREKNSVVEIKYLKQDAKESEISRMLGSQTPSGTALEHARELMKSFKA